MDTAAVDDLPISWLPNAIGCGERAPFPVSTHMVGACGDVIV
jgi:hypothetical protein